MSIIDCKIDEEESQSDEAKNELQEYTDIELHAPHSAVQNYTKKVPRSERASKSPFTSRIIQKRTPAPPKVGPTSYSAFNPGNKAARKILSMTQQLATG